MPFLMGAGGQQAYFPRSHSLSGLSRVEIERDLRLFSKSQRVAIDVMARTLFGEARGEKTDEALMAIAHVILNRTVQKGWPNSPEKVARQRSQFSCWNRNDPNCQLIQRVSLESKHFRRAYRAAMNAMLRKADPINGANHYHSIHMKKQPFWASCEQGKKVARFGNHLFYKL